MKLGGVDTRESWSGCVWVPRQPPSRSRSRFHHLPPIPPPRLLRNPNRQSRPLAASTSNLSISASMEEFLTDALFVARVCARPVSPVTMPLELSSVSPKQKSPNTSYRTMAILLPLLLADFPPPTLASASAVKLGLVGKFVAF
jgi:hypothetical protein